MPPARPIPQSYWVRPGRFLAGEYPYSHAPREGRSRLAAFAQQGFDTFIDLTVPGELPDYGPELQELGLLHGLEIRRLRFPIGDMGLPSPEQMKATLDAIDAALNAGRRLYLHCWGGIGRTGTTVGCYLVRHGLSGPQALEQLARWWAQVPKSVVHPRSPETEAQMDFVRNWRE